MACFEATRAARFARFEALRAARQPVFDAIAAQSHRRAAEVASWGVDRGWPRQRVREAFAVWRYGAMHVAEHSWDAAGALGADDVARLRRAVTRYERYAAARPGHYPEGGLAALAELATTAAERNAKPYRLHYAIRALDQLSRRMRASDTVDDADRLTRRARRAQRRALPQDERWPPSKDELRLRYRIPQATHNAWPPWVDLDAAGAPLLTPDGEVVVRDAFKRRPGYERQPWVAPKRSSDEYRDVLRDIYLLRGLWPPIDVDGRSQMAHCDDRGEDHLGQRRALPGPYALPEHWRTTPEPADLELARLAPAMGLRRVQRLDVDVRDELLDELRARARAEAAERTDLVQQLRELRETRSHAGDVTTPRAPICPGALADADAGRIPSRPAAPTWRTSRCRCRRSAHPQPPGRRPHSTLPRRARPVADADALVRDVRARGPVVAMHNAAPVAKERSLCTRPRPLSLRSARRSGRYAPLPCAAYLLQPAVPHRCPRPWRAPPGHRTPGTVVIYDTTYEGHGHACSASICAESVQMLNAVSVRRPPSATAMSPTIPSPARPRART